MISPSRIELRVFRREGQIGLFQVTALGCIGWQFLIICKFQPERQRFLLIYIQISDADIELPASAIEVFFHLIQKSLVVRVVNSWIKHIDKTI